ncbi:hypothetical protein B9Z55_015690 [Caenorhabditis nigoni]|uniref:Uncharacterized protein n=1 Tax=Caenorhabditis nigoni TaxID=1611254 RepID=A0A2G5UBN2_9PELO|nr:hypothetical protein B9Z55_015690 [Caenorhabditis nigoni]
MGQYSASVVDGHSKQAISNITAIWDKLSFLEENCPWIKKMTIKMNVLYLNFLSEDVPAFLNAIRTMEPFRMRNFETLMNRKNDRLDSVCLRGWGYYGDSLDLKLWRTTDVSLNKEAYAYAYNRHSFEPLREHF